MGWLDNLLKNNKKASGGVRLPPLDLRGVQLPQLLIDLGERKAANGRLPNASVIYAIGAGMLLAFTLYSFFTGAWLTGFILLIPMAAMIGFSIHFMNQ